MQCALMVDGPRYRDLVGGVYARWSVLSFFFCSIQKSAVVLHSHLVAAARARRSDRGPRHKLKISVPFCRYVIRHFQSRKHSSTCRERMRRPATRRIRSLGELRPSHRTGVTGQLMGHWMGYKHRGRMTVVVEMPSRS